MLGAMSIGHWAIVVLVLILLFGKNKISSLMQDLGGGIKALRKGMSEITEDTAEIKQIVNKDKL